MFLSFKERDIDIRINKGLYIRVFMSSHFLLTIGLKGVMFYFCETKNNSTESKKKIL